MSGIDTNRVAYGTNLLRVTFADEIGNVIVITGTGFWICFDQNLPVFVTNRHNIDPRMKCGPETKYRLFKLEIQLRRTVNSVWQDDTEFFAIWNPTASVFLSPDADCALVAKFSWEHRELDYQCWPVTMKPEEIANEDFHRNKLKMMDRIAFVGFPGGPNAPWFDTRRQLPIARSGCVASLPQHPLENPAVVATKDVTLVDGMSYPGSSGSPVFSLEKGVPMAGGGDHAGYAPPRIIGIMSGHWSNGSKENPQHSGLSYYTRSTSIIRLLQMNNLWP